MLYPLIDKKRKKHTKRLSLGDAAEGWREQFNCGEVDNFEAVSTYANCQAMAAAVSDPDAKMNFAERFLQMAVSMMPSINRDSRYLGWLAGTKVVSIVHNMIIDLGRSQRTAPI